MSDQFMRAQSQLGAAERVLEYTDKLAAHWRSDEYIAASPMERRQLLADHLTEHETLHNQQSFYGLARQVIEAGDMCGTTACAAGWDSLLRGQSYILPSALTPGRFYLDGHIMDHARDSLGLDEAEAAVLFYQVTNAAAVRFLRTGSYAPAYNY